LHQFGVADGLSELLEWSEPVIFDCLNEIYRKYVPEKDVIAPLARLHGRAWRALIAGDMRRFRALRRELAAALQPLGIGPTCMAAADARALGELHDIVVARFQRCGRIAHGYRLALVEIANRLTPVLQAA